MLEEKDLHVALEAKCADKVETDTAQGINSLSNSTQALRKMSRHESCDSYAGEERSAIDLLKDFKDPDYLAARECELGSSGEQDSPLAQRLKSRESALESSRWECRGNTEFQSGGGGISTTSSMSDLCGGEDGAGDWESSSIKSGTASVDAGLDALAVLGEGSEADLDNQDKQLYSKSDPCLSSRPIPQSTLDLSSTSQDILYPRQTSDTSTPSKDVGSPSISSIGTSNTTLVAGQKSIEDVMSKYRPAGKNTLREGLLLLF